MEKKQIDRQLITQDRLDQELFDLLTDCKEVGDRTNTVAALRLLGQRIGAYTDKVQNEDITAPAMSDEELQAITELARERNIQISKVS